MRKYQQATKRRLVVLLEGIEDEHARVLAGVEKTHAREVEGLRHVVGQARADAAVANDAAMRWAGDHSRVRMDVEDAKARHSDRYQIQIEAIRRERDRALEQVCMLKAQVGLLIGEASVDDGKSTSLVIEMSSEPKENA